MNNEIIVKKIDWSATLNQLYVGESHQFKVSAKEMINIRQVASRLKKRVGKLFITSILCDSIEVKREA